MMLEELQALRRALFADESFCQSVEYYMRAIWRLTEGGPYRPKIMTESRAAQTLLQREVQEAAETIRFSIHGFIARAREMEELRR
jgi:hypothetical protein